MMRKKTKLLTQGALIAALYVVLTYITNLAGMASGAVQVRISEALCILPAFTASAVPGLFAGCLAANLLTGAALWDVVFGSVATLLGALGTRYFGRNKFLAPIFPIVSNTVIIPLVLKLAYGLSQGYIFLALSIFIGEVISCGVLGAILYGAIEKTKLFK
ncbi:MAG: QueT transporter family protein [Clostridia bacterium]|nr:QueT transporter family protein [Clostridia bacterium]